MNRTIEQWVALRAAVGGTMLEDAVSDLQELARQLETERAAWSAKRSELLRNHDAELARRKIAEVQRDELLNMLNEVEDGDLLYILGVDNFNRYVDILKGDAQ